jgi:hypothetical protein
LYFCYCRSLLKRFGFAIPENVRLPERWFSDTQGPETAIQEIAAFKASLGERLTARIVAIAPLLDRRNQPSQPPACISYKGMKM